MLISCYFKYFSYICTILYKMGEKLAYWRGET